ncbi:MAG: pyrimidine dimer DNA glycosylase/endonuclease V [Bacteroidia bacterium]
MRIWSIHPKYLDAKGLVALWRETLLAKHVLEGKTKGYKNHPQLDRFKKLKRPIDAINQYSTEIYKEVLKRNYKFDKDKINWGFESQGLTVTSGQIEFEMVHLLKKQKSRDLQNMESLKTTPFLILILFLI